MPRQGARKRPAANAAAATANAPAAKRVRKQPTTEAVPSTPSVDVETDPSTDDGFHLRCSAVLLTWNVQGNPSATEALELLKETPHWELVKHYTICAEFESHWHIHAYLEFNKRVDHAATGWLLEGVAPNVQPNRTNGSGFSQAVKRGSFYVANEYKKSFRSNVMNFYPAGSDTGGATYSVKTQWVIDQWSQGKLRDPVECAGRYRCLTPPFKAMVTMSQGQQTSLARQEFLKARRLRLAAMTKPFKSFPECETFAKQFQTDRFRYHFMWFWGNTQLGKTELAKSLDANFLHHKNSIDWMEWDAMKHSTVIFDDCGDIESYILHHKMLFQASDKTTVNTSRTNCHALEVDTTAKRIIVCANHPPLDGWIIDNCIELHITEPTWILNDTTLTADKSEALTAEDEAASDAALAAALAAALPAAWPIFTAPTVRTEVASSSSSAPMFIFEE